MILLVRCVFLIGCLFSLTALNAKEQFLHFYSQDKKTKNKDNASDEGASAKGNFVIQPAINFGYHSGFIKIRSGFGYDYSYTGLMPGITLNLDYNVHNYASTGLYYGTSFQKFTVSNVFYLGHVFGTRCIFHWWQMLADKSGKNLLSEKIDFDIHGHIGGFLATEKNLNTNQKLKKLGINGGGGIGFKYYFVKHFGVALDAGYEEASWLKLGFAIKI